MEIAKLSLRRLGPFTLTLLVLTILSSYAVGTQRTSAHVQSTIAHRAEKEPRQPGTPPGTPIESLLNDDGALNLGTGFTGSLDPAGWDMVDGPGGEPRFARADSGGAKTSRQSIDAPGDENWDDRFCLPGVSGPVYVITVAGDSVYVGGSFATAGDIPANYIASWDGTRWHSLGAGLYDDVEGGSVFAIAINGSDVYVGGDFIRAGDVPANGIARWDGNRWHSLGNGVLHSTNRSNGFVGAIELIGDDIYVAGSFTIAGEITANNIARWNGSQWSTLGSGLTSGGYSGAVSSMSVVGANLYVGGRFTQAGEVPANQVARWDGSQWHALGEGPNNGINDDSVYVIAANGNDVYVGGNFSMAGGVPVRNIARWDGNQWSPLGIGASSGVDNVVYAIALNGNNVYVGGHFSTAGGVAAERIARWDGAQWHSLGAGVSSAGFPIVYTITLNGEGIYVGGEFTVGGQVNASRIAQWDGNQWSPLGNGPGNGVHGSIFALAFGNNRLYVGGTLLRTGEIEVGRIAQWDGSQWSPLGSGVRHNEGKVNAIAVNGNNVYVGGSFAIAGDVTANYIAKWDGNRWASLGSGMDRDVQALAVSKGRLYAGGAFTTAGGVPAKGIASWDGNQWSSIGGGADNGVNGTVSAIAVSGGDVYAGGVFSTAGGISAGNIARWDGSNWSALGGGVNNSVHTIAAQGQDVYAGGSFTMAGSITAYRVAKWAGSEWEALGSGVSDCLIHHPACAERVNALVISAEGVYAGGNFLKAGGVEVNYIARWDGSQWMPLGSGMASSNRNSPVYAIAAGSNGSEVYAGGAFTAAGGKSSNALGLWHATCPSSFSDLPFSNTFYPYILCLACQGVIGGYDDGTFRPNNSVTRGQLSKITSDSAGFSDPPGEQLFEDVAPGSTFYNWIQRLAGRGHIVGYPCGAEYEPCIPPLNRPYFRPNANATRGQISKIISNAKEYNDPPGTQLFEDVPSSNAFYVWVHRLASRGVMGGYPCGGPGEPCISGKPYFRPQNNATRGQSSKIVSNTFFPSCNPPL